MKVKGLRSKNTIVLHPSEGEPISISKETNELLFLEVSDLLESGDLDELMKKYIDIKGKIEKYSSNLFTVDSEKGEMYLKGDDKPMPDLITEKLLELEKEGEDFMPLIRFWKKLKKNPSQESINQLYGFMVHNGIGLTESGDVIVEKGVSAKGGNLVDSFSGKFNNNIGETVEMPRDEVDTDPNRTCSNGLHVGAPDYVRDFYSGIIVKCSVNPMDVVAVPVDYNNTKMRVCKYAVVGYSDENTTHKPIYKLSDFVTLPIGTMAEILKNSMPKNDDGKVYEDAKEIPEIEFKEEEEIEYDEYLEIATDILTKLTGKLILDFVEEETGVRMPYSDKSKSTLVKRGAELLAKHMETLDNK
jgi:hypothetical protein